MKLFVALFVAALIGLVAGGAVEWLTNLFTGDLVAYAAGAVAWAVVFVAIVISGLKNRRASKK